MKTRNEMIEDGVYDANKSFSHKIIITFYQDQLEKFEKLGIGKSTENDTIITPSLIAVTRKRLGQLLPMTTMRKGKTNEDNK